MDTDRCVVGLILKEEFHFFILVDNACGIDRELLTGRGQAERIADTVE